MSSGGLFIGIKHGNFSDGCKKQVYDISLQDSGIGSTVCFGPLAEQVLHI